MRLKNKAVWTCNLR